MIEIGAKVLEPSYWRKPHYVGYEPGTAPYSFNCPHCGLPIQVSLCGSIASDVAFSSEDLKRIKEYFEIGVVGKSQDGGWPVFSRVTCKECGQTYLFYVGVDEPTNSFYKITVQGICELKENDRNSAEPAT